MTEQFRRFNPEKTLIPEAEGRLPSEGTQVVVDADGTIAFVGTKEAVDQWTQSRQDEGATVEIEEGGVLFPGLTDTHFHPGIYGMLELVHTTDVSTARSVEELQRAIREAKSQGERAAGEPLLVLNYDSSLLPSLDQLNIDEVEQTHPVFIIDRSFHGGAGNSAAMQMLNTYLESQFASRKQKTGGWGFPGKISGQTFSEMFVILALDLAESFQSVEKIEEKIEHQVDEYLSKGVTAVHELDVTSWNQFMAYLLYFQDWKQSGQKGEFPVRRLFISDRILERVVHEHQALMDSGLLTDDIKGIMGVKLYADGAFGCETALLSEPYLSEGHKHKHGIIVNRVKEAERAMKNVIKLGLNKVAVHAIGDAGIRRALDFAQRWQKMGNAKGSNPQFRFEHFELPTQDTIKGARDIGAWVSMQSNFGVEDFVYQDRLGGRARLLCPHQDMVNEGVPMMLGSDGMPTSMLYVVWSAMHHPNPDQRLDAISAMTAASAAAGAYEGTGKGHLTVGAKTDIVIADPRLLQMLQDGKLAEDYFRDAARPAGERSTPIRNKVSQLESAVTKVFRNGEVVYRATH